MDWLESLLFGLVSGLTEILPVSAQAHQALLCKLFGAESSALLRLMIRGAVFAALFISLRDQISLLLRERALSRIPVRRRKRQPDWQRVLDLRLLKTALVPMLLAFLAFSALESWQYDLSKAALFLLVNGLILYIPGHMPSANKDSRAMSQLDGLFMGVAGGAAVLPGISRVGAIASVGIARGADREHALRWSLLLSIPALAGVMCFDVIDLFQSGAGALSIPLAVNLLLSAAAAFMGAMAGIRTMSFLAVRAGFSGFAYYCWGTALFSFLMYLTI